MAESEVRAPQLAQITAVPQDEINGTLDRVAALAPCHQTAPEQLSALPRKKPKADFLADKNGSARFLCLFFNVFVIVDKSERNASFVLYLVTRLSH